MKTDDNYKRDLAKYLEKRINVDWKFIIQKINDFENKDSTGEKGK